MSNRRLPATTIVAVIGCLLTAACADTAPTAPSSRLAAPAASADRQQPSFVIETIDVPGALGTSAQGINAAGDIVGFYADASGRTHGFLLRDGAFTTIDYQDPVTGEVADNTSARGIGPAGDIVGTHSNIGEEPVAAHGYHRTPDGAFMPVHFPGHLNEIPQRILADGTMLGCRHDHDTMDSMRGIVIHGTQTAEMSNLYSSMTNGATPDGQIIVGFYVNMMIMPAQTQAFVIQGGDTTAFTVPGTTFTTAWDVNPRGDIVGVFRDAAGVHGYVRTNSGRTLEGAEYTPVDVSGASATRAFGINARGDVVGTYVAGGTSHGFRATRVR